MSRRKRVEEDAEHGSDEEECGRGGPAAAAASSEQQHPHTAAATSATPVRPTNGPDVPTVTSLYTGVSWHRYSQCWMVQLRCDGKRHCLGYFKSELEAARAYDTQVLKMKGEGFPINFPTKPGQIAAVKKSSTQRSDGGGGGGSGRGAAGGPAPRRAAPHSSSAASSSGRAQPPSRASAGERPPPQQQHSAAARGRPASSSSSPPPQHHDEDGEGQLEEEEEEEEKEGGKAGRRAGRGRVQRRPRSSPALRRSAAEGAGAFAAAAEGHQYQQPGFPAGAPPLYFSSSSRAAAHKRAPPSFSFSPSDGAGPSSLPPLGPRDPLPGPPPQQPREFGPGHRQTRPPSWLLTSGSGEEDPAVASSLHTLAAACQSKEEPDRGASAAAGGQPSRAAGPPFSGKSQPPLARVRADYGPPAAPAAGPQAQPFHMSWPARAQGAQQQQQGRALPHHGAAGTAGPTSTSTDDSDRGADRGAHEDSGSEASSLTCAPAAGAVGGRAPTHSSSSGRREFGQRVLEGEGGRTEHEGQALHHFFGAGGGMHLPRSLGSLLQLSLLAAETPPSPCQGGSSGGGGEEPGPSELPTGPHTSAAASLGHPLPTHQLLRAGGGGGAGGPAPPSSSSSSVAAADGDGGASGWANWTSLYPIDAPESMGSSSGGMGGGGVASSSSSSGVPRVGLASSASAHWLHVPPPVSLSLGTRGMGPIGDSFGDLCGLIGGPAVSSRLGAAPAAASAATSGPGAGGPAMPSAYGSLMAHGGLLHL